MQASPNPSLHELSRFTTTEKLTLSDMYVVLKQHLKDKDYFILSQIKSFLMFLLPQRIHFGFMLNGSRENS